MDILFAIREDYQERIGGDTFQFLFTKQYLEKNYGTNIIVLKKPEEIADYPDIKVIHVFNMQHRDWTYNFLKKAKDCGKKTILSTIYWDFSDVKYAASMMRFTADMRVLRLVRPFKNILRLMMDVIRRRDIGDRKNIESYRELLQLADMILPNSCEEAELLERIFGHMDYQVRTVPNAIAPLVERDCVKDVPQVYHDCILQVGRIEHLKNQGGVIQACMDNDIPIVFIGRIEDPHYYNKIKKYADKRGNVHFLGEMSQEKIADYYSAAKVHVLPSLRESPGLVTLEAMYYGCNVVVSNEKYCPIKYYQLEKYGYVCNPFSVNSIRKAIEKAYYDQRRQYDESLFQFISYENAAKHTQEAYNAILADCCEYDNIPNRRQNNV